MSNNERCGHLFLEFDSFSLKGDTNVMAPQRGAFLIFPDYMTHLTDQEIELTTRLLIPLGHLLWNMPEPVRILLCIPILEVARCLELKIDDGEQIFEIKYMGELKEAFLCIKTNHWEVEPNGDPLSTELCARVFSNIELASIVLHEDLLHLEEAIAFLYDNFPFYRS